MSLPRIFQKVFHEPALMTAAAHESIQQTLINHIRGGNAFDVRLDKDQTAQVKNKGYKLIRGNVALVNVSGVISKRLSLVEAGCGMYEQSNITNNIKQAVDDPRVESIIVDFDSPGGSVTGTFEAGRMIRSLATQKPIYGYTETMSCSASYWLMAQCTGIIAAPSATLGSIGVYIAWAKDSTEYEMVKAGKYKAMGLQELSEEDREMLQDNVDKTHALFKAEVTAMRPQIESETMEGQTFDGNEAVENGLADATAMNFDEALDIIMS